MSADVRTRMIEGAAMLLALKGVEGTSFTEVLKATGTPRGSIYHHFPEGKDALIEEAVDLLAAQAFDPLEKHGGASAEKIARAFVDLWRTYLVGSELQAGCAILAVTVTADSARLVARAAGVFRKWRERLAALLEQGGLSRENAVSFAATLIAAIEGAMVFSRAEQSLEPFELVAKHMVGQVRRLAAKPDLELKKRRRNPGFASGSRREKGRPL